MGNQLHNSLTALITPPIMADINPVTVQKVIITVVYNATLGAGGQTIEGQVRQGPGGAVLFNALNTQAPGLSDGAEIRVEDTPAFLANGGQYQFRIGALGGQTVNGSVNIAHMTVESWP